MNIQQIYDLSVETLEAFKNYEVETKYGPKRQEYMKIRLNLKEIRSLCSQSRLDISANFKSWYTNRKG